MTNTIKFYKELEKYGLVKDSQFMLNIPLELLREIVDKFSELPEHESKGSDDHELDDDIPPTSQYFSTSSQTEISDEEIEKGAWENQCLSRQDVYELFDEVFKDKTLEGMFKISASKEVRQFKEKLRQLAKEKYREQLVNL